MPPALAGWSLIELPRLQRRVAVDQPLGDALADEMRDIAAERADFLDEPRGDELVAVGGHQEDVFDLGIEAGRSPQHLKPAIQTRKSAPPPEDSHCAHPLR